MTAKTARPLKLKFFSDPGHGWLRVPRKVLADLGIEKDITACSYQKNDWVYLEEDDDCSTFIDAAKEKGLVFKIEHTLTKGGNYSAVRNYRSYRYIEPATT